MLCMLALTVVSAKEKAPEVTEVSAIGEGVGDGGRVLIRVTCAAKKAQKVTDADLRKAALRCVLFRGWTDKSRSEMIDSSSKHQAIAGDPDAETQHADYFTDFFAGTNPANYVEIVPETRRVLKNGKLYEVSSLVTVNTATLRKKLEKDGIIRSLRPKW